MTCGCIYPFPSFSWDQLSPPVHHVYHCPSLLCSQDLLDVLAAPLQFGNDALARHATPSAPLSLELTTDSAMPVVGFALSGELRGILMNAGAGLLRSGHGHLLRGSVIISTPPYPLPSSFVSLPPLIPSSHAALLQCAVQETELGRRGSPEVRRASLRVAR